MQKLHEPRIARRLSLKKSIPNIYQHKNRQEIQSDGKLSKLIQTQNQFQQISGSYKKYIQSIGDTPFFVIGVCLNKKQFELFYQALSGRSFYGASEFQQKNYVTYVNLKQIQIQSVKIVIWIFPPTLDKLSIFQKVLFNYYLPLLIIDQAYQSLLQISQFNPQTQSIITKTLNCNHQIYFFSDIAFSKHQQLNTSVKKLLIKNFKKNSSRILSDVNCINIYLLNQISYYLNQGFHTKRIVNLGQEKILNYIFEETVNEYLQQQVEKKCNDFFEEIQNKLPLSESSIFLTIEEFEEKIIGEIKNNLLLLIPNQKVDSYIDELQERLRQFQEQLVYRNREISSVQNKKILNNYFSSFYQKIQAENYGRQNIDEISQEFETLLTDYENQHVKTANSFSIFNEYMMKNRNRFYRRISELQNDQKRLSLINFKKFQGQEVIKDKIQLKKHILNTLEKQIKNLQIRKSDIQNQNQKLKKNWTNIKNEIQLSNYINSETSDNRDAESLKTINCRKLSSANQQILSQKPQLSKKKYKDISVIENKKSKDGVCCCSKCQIF